MPTTRPPCRSRARRRNARRYPLHVRVLERRLAPLDPFPQLPVDGLVDRGRLVLREPPLPHGVRTLRRVLLPLRQPLLVAVVVGHLRPVERGLEVREGVGGAQEVLPGPVLDDRVDGLAVVGEV